MASIPAHPAETRQQQPNPEPAPHREYTRRHQLRRDEAGALEQKERLLGNARVAVFLVGLGMAWGALGQRLFGIGWLGVPIAVFLALVIVHDGVLRRRAAALRLVRYYERGLARLEDRWQGQGPSGDAFREPAHPYAEDLDLFGSGSLFELVCTARSHEGERLLAEWLLTPAPPEVVRERQDAVRDLRPRLDLREDLAGLGEEVRTEVRTEEIARWGAAEARPIPLWFRLGAVVVAVLTGAALLWWGAGHGPLLFAAAVIGGQAYLAPFRETISRTLRTADQVGRDIGLFARLLARLEAETFQAPRLSSLRAGLERSGPPPSARLAQLERILGFQQSQRNGIFGILAAVLLLSVHLTASLERWRAENGRHLALWIEAAAELEALSALGAYAYEHPDDPFPTLVDEGPRIAADGVAHPLLPASRAVRNTVSLGGDLRLLVISGSNMSGKSTLLRALGTNVVLALAGAPVRAYSMTLSPLAIGTSIRVQDSLQAGASHFYAEITRLRQVVDLVSGPLPLLFMLDEILHGTNSHDRRIGAEAVVRTLVARGAIGLVTTHDLALTRIVEDPELHAVNVHFEDHLEDGKMTFDYHLLPGVVQKSNALELMRAVGLDV